MSDEDEAVGDQATTPPTRRRWPARRVAAALALGLLLVSVGYVAGVRSPWVAHQPRVEHGTVQRVPSNVPYAYFDPDDGDRVGFRLDDVAWRWESGGRSNSAMIPGCLREPGEKVEMDVGLIEVARPFGSGSYEKVLSLTCPAE